MSVETDFGDADIRRERPADGYYPEAPQLAPVDRDVDPVRMEAV
jgi:hypothetical protein